MTTRPQAATLVNSNITTNGVGAITGAILNSDLQAIISACAGYQGVWSSSNSYQANDMVLSASSGGILYIALQDNINQALSNTAYWQSLASSSGSGTVNSGTIGQLAYYAASGTAVSGVTLTGYVYGNGASAPTASTTIPTTALSGTVTNAQLANSSITVNGTTISLGSSGTITAVAAAGSLTGTTLAANVVSSSLTSVGTISSGVWNGTVIGIGYGGTGQTTASAGFNALSPITTAGDLIIGNGINSATRLGIGANGYVLTSTGTTATWAAGGNGTVNSGTGGQLAWYSSTSNTVSGNANLTVSSAALTIGVQGTTQGSLVLANTGSAVATTVQSSNSASAAWTLVLPTTAGTGGQVLQTNGSGVTSWVNPASTGTLTIGSTAISGGTTGYYLTVGAGGVLQQVTAPSATITIGSVVGSSSNGYGLYIGTGGSAGTLQQFAYGTGVFTALGLAVNAASGLAAKDANSNLSVNALFEGFTSVAAAGTTTTLTAASAPTYVVTGSGGQTFQLPDATTLPAGAVYSFNNNQTSGTVVVKNNSGTTLTTLQSGAFVDFILLVNSPAAGSWDNHAQAPSNVSWSTNTLSWAGSITGSTWNGAAVGAAYGGTGVANNAASTLTISGTFGTTLTVTGTTAVTLPTSGTLATTANIATAIPSATSSQLYVGTGAAGALAAATTGTGVVTALGTNVGSTGAFVVNGGALGTPSSGTLTNATGLPIGGLTGLGTGVATALALAVNGTSGLVTGAGVATAGGVSYGNGTNLAYTAAGTAGQVVLSGGASAPSFTTGTLALAGNLSFTGAFASVFSVSGAYTYTMPGASSTLAGLGNANSWTASQTFNAATSSIYLGANSGNNGVATFYGSTSGSVTVKPAAVAGTSTLFQLPATNGTSGQVLQTDGTGVTSWATAGGGSSSPTGTILPFAGLTQGFGSATPSGYLLCAGQSVSQSTYSSLFAVLNPSTTSVTFTFASPGVVNITGHGLVAGDPVAFSSTLLLPTGITAYTTYYVIAAGLTANAFEISASQGGSAINFTGTNTGTNSCYRVPYGTITSTNFIIPDLRGRTAFGQDNMGGTAAGRITTAGSGVYGQVVGSAGGAETVTQTSSTLFAHTHSFSAATTYTEILNLGCTNYYVPVSNSASTTGSTGSSAAAQNLSPGMIVNYIIKT